MRNKTLSSIAVAALASQLTYPAVAANEINTANLFADVQLKKNYCISMRVHMAKQNQFREQILVGINGENLRSNSFSQIKTKLNRSGGKIVKVEVGYTNGDTETLDVQLINSPRNELCNENPTRMFERAADRITSSPSYINILEKSASNTDLIARSACIQAPADASDSPGQVNTTNVLLSCMLLSQAIGDFDSADHYLALALIRMKEELPSASITFPAQEAVENLVALGKLAEAETICKYLLAPAPNHVPRLPAAISILELYSLIPSASAQNASRELAKSIYAGTTSQVVSFHDDYFWLGQYLESLGMNTEALDLFSKHQEKLQKDAILDTGLLGAQAAAYCLYSKARLEALLGKKAQAEKDLDAIRTVYNAMSEKRQKLLNRIPEYFPTTDDVENAKLALQKSDAIVAPPKQWSYSNRPEYDASGEPVPLALHFPEALKCFALIKANEKAQAERVSEELVAAYQVSSPTGIYRVRQNLFCTILNVARAFADHGWYNASNKLLMQLESAARAKTPKIADTDIAWTMIIAERSYNAVSAGTKPETQPLKSANSKTDTRRGIFLPVQDMLSPLAMAYDYAGETQRAKVFIDQYVAQIDNQSEKNLANNQALVTAADIYAKLHDYKKADKYLDYVFAQHFPLNKPLASSLLAIAATYSDNGQTEKAISVMEKTSSAIPAPEHSWYVEKIDTRLAELYQKNEQYDQALRTISKVLSDSSRFHTTVSQENLIAAQACEKLNKLSEAAKYFYEAGKWRGVLGERQREELLRKAIYCNDKSANFDKAISAKAYIALCGLVDRKNLAEGLALHEKAVSLLDDGDPEKPKQLSEISYIKGELQKGKATEANSLTTPNKTVAAPNSISVSSSDAKIYDAKKAAELAAKSNSKEASEYWFRLATAEAEAHKLDSAVEHARKGIAAYTSATAKTQTLYQLLNSGLPSILAKAGSPDQAELLLNEAQSRVESVAGAGSLQSQVQMAHDFDFLVLQQKDYAKADKLLDLLLKTNLSQGRYAPPDHNVFICRFGGGPYPVESSNQVIEKLFNTAKQSVVGKDNKVALGFLNKILQAEIKQFGSNDYRVATAYVEIARVHSAAEENTKAYDAYSTAISIMHMYEAMQFILSNTYPDYYNVLRKLDKQSEIEKAEDQKLADQKDHRFDFGGRQTRRVPVK